MQPSVNQQGDHREAERTEEAQDQLRHHLGQLRAYVRQEAERLRADRKGSLTLYAPFLVQLRVAEDTNINFWGNPTGEMPICETGIHNHYVDFQSDILLGELKNLKYRVTNNPAGQNKRFVVTRKQDDGGQWQFAIEGGTERADIEQISEDVYRPGDRYQLFAPEYHSNEITVPTVTLMHIDLATRGAEEDFLVDVDDKDYTTTLTMRTPRDETQLDEAWHRIDAFLALMDQAA
jgi:hypothetical protein